MLNMQEEHEITVPDPQGTSDGNAAPESDGEKDIPVYGPDDTDPDASSDTDDDSEDVDREIASEEVDDEVEDAEDASEANLQAHLALAVIRSKGITPRYMSAVSHGTLIGHCFESASSVDHVQALESLSRDMTDRWKNIKYALGKWKDTVLGTVASLAATAGISLGIRHAVIYKKIRDLAASHKYDVGHVNLTDNGVVKVRLETRVITKGKGVVISKSVFTATDDVHKVIAYTADHVAKTKMRMTRKFIPIITKYNRLMQICASIVVISYIGHVFSGNTPAALLAATKVDLPTDADTYHAYKYKVATTINKGCNFGITLDEAANLEHDGTVVSVKVSDIDAHIKRYYDDLKRFSAIPEVLDRITKDAATSGNPWSVQGATFLVMVCKAIVNDSMSHTGTFRNLMLKCDKFMDQFHEVSDAD